MSIYDSKEFKALKAEWYNKLEADGFKDLEDAQERLYCPDTRTIAWTNRERILAFYTALSTYLHEFKRLIPDRDHKILSLWTSGVYFTKIAKQTGHSLATVKNTCYHHRKIVLDTYF